MKNAHEATSISGTLSLIRSVTIWGLLPAAILFLLAVRNSESVKGPDQSDKALPIYGTVPDTSLTQSNGSPFSPTDLHGRVWVATLFFTHCSGTCPAMASQMATLQEKIGTEQVALVSVSVDPERDTLERLAWYADMVKAKPGVWYFVTGEKDTLITLAEKHFHLGVGLSGSDQEPAPATVAEVSAETALEIPDYLEPEELAALETSADDIPHSTRFALVDQQGRIRGYYDGMEDAQVTRLQVDAKKLLAEGA